MGFTSTPSFQPMAHPAASFTSVLEIKAFPYVPLALTNHLRKHFVDKQVLPIPNIPLDEYLAEIQLEPVEDVKRRWSEGHSSLAWCSTSYRADGGQVQTYVLSGHLVLQWEDVTFDIFRVHWPADYKECDETYFALIFDGATDDKGRAFFRTVSSWDDARKADGSLGICVFENESFHRDQAMAAAIKSTTSKDLVLEAGMLDQLRRDVITFFNSKSIYKALNLGWKRGVLFLGPPGNGKTHAIKVILFYQYHIFPNSFAVSC